MLIKVKVKPGSSKQEIIKQQDGSYLIFLKKEAKKGKANAELINLLAKHFKVCVSDISIKGKTSREKLVEIRE